MLKQGTSGEWKGKMGKDIDSGLLFFTIRFMELFDL